MLLEGIVDKVYILTLNETVELRRYYGLKFGENKIEFYTPKTTTSKIANEGSFHTSFWDILCHKSVDSISKNITMNHIHMIQMAIENKELNNVLFLEDDARFTYELTENKQTSVKNWMDKNRWDIFYLGYCPWPYLVSMWIHPNIVKIYSPLTTHAYILNRNGREKIISYYYQHPEIQHLHIDKIFSMKIPLRKYAIFPAICFQEKDPALYTKAMDYVGINIPFSLLSKGFEYFSLLTPLLVFIIALFVFLYMNSRNKTT